MFTGRRVKRPGRKKLQPKDAIERLKHWRGAYVKRGDTPKANKRKNKRGGHIEGKIRLQGGGEPRREIETFQLAFKGPISSTVRGPGNERRVQIRLASPVQVETVREYPKWPDGEPNKIPGRDNRRGNQGIRLPRGDFGKIKSVTRKNVSRATLDEPKRRLERATSQGFWVIR